MQTVLVGLAAGLVVGIVCVFYVFLRTRKLVSAAGPKAKIEPGESMPYAEERTSSGMMFMALIGSGSMLWGFIGAGIYHLIRDDWQFFILSAIVASAINVWIWTSKTTFATDKMILTFVIVLGLGFLIPWLI